MAGSPGNPIPIPRLLNQNRTMFIIISYIFYCCAGLYITGLLIFLSGLYFPNRKRQSEHLKVSVVIAARNEETSIGHLLSDLKKQTYPQACFEVIVADDHSTDRTAELVRDLVQSDPRFHLMRVNTTEKGLTAKKNAIHQALQKSRGEIILSVDADCRVKSTWIETMVSYFTPETGMVVGFSQLGRRGEKRSIFEKIQALDFLMLCAAAQGSLNLGIPLAATGQNLGYRRKAFEEIGGFSKVGHRISGDDVLLLQLISRHSKWKIRFAPDKRGYNSSNPEQTLHRFLHQRTRWASNGSYQARLNPGFFLYVLNTYITNLTSLTILPVSLLTDQPVVLPAIGLTLKWVAEFLLAMRGARVYHRTDLLAIFPLWAILQIPYVVYIGAAGTLGQFTWKNRKHRAAGRQSV